MSPDGSTLYSGSLAHNSVTVVDVATLRPIRTITGFDEPRQAIVLSHDGARAYVLNKDLSIAAVDLVTGVVARTIR